MLLLKMHCCLSPCTHSGQTHRAQVRSAPRLPCWCWESDLSWKQPHHNLPWTPDNLSVSHFSVMALPLFPSQRQPFCSCNDGSAPTMFLSLPPPFWPGMWLSPVLPRHLLPWNFFCSWCLFWLLLESNEMIFFELLIQISYTLKSTGNCWGAPGDCWDIYFRL